MHALLINPWIYDFAAYDLWAQPLGLLSIAAHLRAAGWHLSLIDCRDRLNPALATFLGERLPPATPHGCGPYHAEEIPRPPVFRGLVRRYKRYGYPRGLFTALLDAHTRPDIILVTSGMTYWYPAVVDVVTLARERFPGVPIVVGGTYVNLAYDHARKTVPADAFYRGNDMAEIMTLIAHLAGADTVPPHTPARMPAYDLYPRLAYATLMTSRGCPFRCSYCGWYLTDDRYTRHEPLTIVATIEALYRKDGVRNFAFYDDALLYDAADHLFPILDGIADRGIAATFHTPNGLHNRFVTAELARRFRHCGFHRPRLALESSSAARQHATGSKTTTEDFIRAVAYLTEAGYHPRELGANILIGLPGQTADEVEASVRFVAATGIRIFLEEYSPIPGTPDYERSGLAPDADPLIHNNSVFPLLTEKDRVSLQRVKDLAHRLNERLRGV